MNRPIVGIDGAEAAQIAQDDKFLEIDGERFAGLHLLLELWRARRLDDENYIEQALKRAATAARATILDIRLHKFSPSGGVTGVVLLAESHLSIHTWPEHAYAAVDIFMCGRCDAYQAITPIKRAFAPERLEISEHRRGRLSAGAPKP